MALASPLRAGVSLAAGLAAAWIAAWLGSPPEAFGFCGLLGGLTAWFASASTAEDGTATAPPSPDPEPETPAIESLIGAVDDPMILIEGRLLAHANHAARELLGDHVIGQDVRLAIRHPAAAERLTGRSRRTEGSIELIGLGDRERRWELTVHELGGDRRLARLYDRSEAHATEQMRIDFVANASHELRTPLATLIGFIETLEDSNAGEDAATRARFLKIMFGEAKRMQQLVGDLISLSRIEAEKHLAPQTAIPLAPLIEEVACAVRATMREGADRIIIETEDIGPVLGDPAQLSQLLHNLLSNALKYGRPGTPVTISLTCANPPDMARLSISDEGEGIAAEHLPRLTERFYRIDPGRSRGLGGTGLGLAIVKHIVERHRGRLDIESELGVGTTVTVLLALAPEAASSKSHEIVTGDTSNETSAVRGAEA